MPQPDATAANLITIRLQRRDDLAAIADINARAFADHGGTQSFDEIRTTGDNILSLVAVTPDNSVVGQIIFSPVRLETETGNLMGMGLGQLAVDPAHQSQGIGSLLSNTGIDQLRERRCPFVIVIGHAGYYPRFGFEPGVRHNIKCQWDGIPEDSFMVMFPCGLSDALQQAGADSLRGMAFFLGL